MLKHVTIAVSGKGGVGKTTVAALLIKVLRDRNEGPVFAVDADPNSCLADYLGLTVEETVGSMREETLKNISEIPPGMTKERWISYRMQECLVESTGIDLIVMGRPEGPGCYCYVNNLLRQYEHSMYSNYRYTVIDNEAGMEHLSRRTTQKIDYLLIVSDLTIPGLKAAVRIRDLSRDLNLVTRYTALILNNVENSLFNDMHRFIEETGLEVIGRLPNDVFLKTYGFSNGSLLDIPDENGVLRAVRDIAMALDL